VLVVMQPLYVGCTKPNSHWLSATCAWLQSVGCYLRKMDICKTGTSYLPRTVCRFYRSTEGPTLIRLVTRLSINNLIWMLESGRQIIRARYWKHPHR